MQPIQKTKRSFVACGCAAMLILAGSLAAPAPAQAPVAPITEVDGLTEPYRTIDVVAPEPGLVAKIAVHEGEFVRQGQVLASLDNDVHAATLAVAQKNMEAVGNLNSALAEVQLRQDRLEKMEQLRGQGHARQEEVDRARAELNIAQAKLLAVQEDLAIKKLEFEKIKVQIERRIIRAPADGVISKSVKDEGEYAAPNDPQLFTIVQLDRLISAFPVPSPVARELRVDQTVRVSFANINTPAEGIVEFVSPVTDAESGTVKVKVRLDNPKGIYRSGERCTLELAPAKRTANR